MFAQKDGETFAQVWEHFKDLLLVCPHHGFEKCGTVSFFYDWLNPSTKKFVETMCQGKFLAKNEKEAEEYFEWLAEHTQIERRMGIVAGVYSRLKA